MNKRRNIAWTLVAIAAMALAVTGVADSASDDYSDEAFKRGLVTFAIARALNGVISVAQGTEVAVEPGGVGVNFTVGRYLTRSTISSNSFPRSCSSPRVRSVCRIFC